MALHKKEGDIDIIALAGGNLQLPFIQNKVMSHFGNSTTYNKNMAKETPYDTIDSIIVYAKDFRIKKSNRMKG